MIWAGVGIALFGALGYALGAALQQHEAASHGATLKLTRRPRWWIGGVIGFAGASLHAVALSMAPLVIVQPISVATLVFAVPLAAWLHGRRPHRAEILGSLAVSAGLLGLMLLIPARDVPPELSGVEGIGLIAVVACFVAVCFAVARFIRGPYKALVLAVGAGAVTATVSTFVRVVGGGFEGDFAHLLQWSTLAVPVLLVCAVVLLQHSYAVGYFGVAYAGVQVIDPITSVLAGTLLLGESLPTGPGQAVAAVVAGAVVAGGTIVLGRRTPEHPEPLIAPAHATVS